MPSNPKRNFNQFKEKFSQFATGLLKPIHSYFMLDSTVGQSKNANH